MTDFTIDELNSILDAFHYARDSASWTKYHEEPNLINKIQSMIDKYGEHQLDDYDLFLPKVGALLTDDKLTEIEKINLIKKLYLEAVCLERFKTKEPSNV